MPPGHRQLLFLMPQLPNDDLIASSSAYFACFLCSAIAETALAALMANEVGEEAYIHVRTGHNFYFRTDGQCGPSDGNN